MKGVRAGTRLVDPHSCWLRYLRMQHARMFYLTRSVHVLFQGASTPEASSVYVDTRALRNDRWNMKTIILSLCLDVWLCCHQILIPRKTHEESVDCRNTISNWASEVTRHCVGFVPFRSVIRLKSRSSLLNNQMKKTLTKRDIFSRIFYTRKNRSHAFTLIFFFLRVRQRAVLISRLSHLHKLAKIALELWKREACAPCPRCLRCTIYFRWLAPRTE